MKSGYERIGRSITVEFAQRSCLDKKKYPSRNRARDSAARGKRLRPDSLPQRPYRCTICGNFHLTSQVPARAAKGQSPSQDRHQEPNMKQSQRLPEEGQAMRSFFYCTMVQRPHGILTYSHGITAMERPDIDVVHKVVLEGLAKDGMEARLDQIVVLAFNEV